MHDTVTVAPDWLLPLDSMPIRNGYLVLHHGRVDFVGCELPLKYRTTRKVELRGYAVLPGLVNAHCHLEFSDLLEPIPAGPTFPDWIRRLIDRRKAGAGDPNEQIDCRRAAVVKGLAESYACGVRWLVDMTTQPWDPDWLAADRRMVVQPCIEMMDVLPERYDRSRMFLEEQCASTMPAWIGPVGLAPHAPYTTSLNVTRRVADRSQQEWRLVSMHLAESRDEMQWLANGTGPFSGLLGPLIGKEFVNSLGSVSEHLVQLEHAHRVLVVHGNYLSVSELDFMAKQSSSFRLVHCPRTHRFFGHTNDDSTCYPLVERVSAGVGHLIGTDSRASNPDLNLWCEAQFLRATHAQLSSLQILRMISLDAIEFLGIADHVGTLSAGRPSSLTCVRAVAPDADENSILDAVLGSSTVSSPIESVVG